MLDFETSNSKLEVSKSNSWKLRLSRKLRHFRGSCFSQCFIPSTSPPLLVIKKGFMIIITLSNYQQCPLPLSPTTEKKKPLCKLSDAQPTAAQPASNQSATTTELGPPITIQITVENSVHDNQETVTIPVTGPAGLTLFQFLQRAMEISGDQFW